MKLFPEPTWTKAYNAKYPFGAKNAKYNPKCLHHIGSDIVVPLKTPILAPCNGEMYKVYTDTAKGHCGVFLFVWEGVEWGLELCHLLQEPKKGKYKTGDVIAYSGNTGTSTTAPHLHITLHRDAMVTKNYKELQSECDFYRLAYEGRIVDPYKWLNEHE